MIKFFRHIRKTRFFNNDIRKYILYALGEILLVMIGILLALQVNNWNEDRKDQLKAKSYLNRISEDLERSINRSSRLGELNRRILKSVAETQVLLERGTALSPEEKEIVDFAFLWFPRTTYQLPNMLTYEEMKSSGDLHLIRDIELRNDLAEFFSYLLQVESIYDKLSSDIESQFDVYNKHIKAKTNPETLEISFSYNFEEICKDDIFIKTFSRMSVHWRGFVYFMERVHTMSKNIKSKMVKL